MSAPYILMSFRYNVRGTWYGRYFGTYVNIQYIGNLGSPLSQYSSTGSTYWTRAQNYKKWISGTRFRYEIQSKPS